MAYIPPDLGNITFDMPTSPYSAPTLGALTITIGGVSTTVIDCLNAPLEVTTTSPTETLWYSVLDRLESGATMGVPDVILTVSVPPFEHTTTLTGTAQQRVICQPLVSTQRLEVRGVQLVPEGYTMISPWPLETTSKLSMDSIALTVVDVAFENNCELEIPFIEAAGETVVYVPPFIVESNVKVDMMPGVGLIPLETGGCTLECSAIKSMPVGDQYLWCPPFECSYSMSEPIIGFSYPVEPLVSESTLECGDVYMGNIAVLEPLQISQELTSKVSAALGLQPMVMGGELSPDFATTITVDLPPIDPVSTIEVSEIFIGTFVECPAFESMAKIRTDTQLSIWLAESDNLTMGSQIPNPEVIKTVICPALSCDSDLSIGDIRVFALDFANQFYYFKIVPIKDWQEPVWIPISSFQSRQRNGAPSYLQVVIPGLQFAPEIDERSSGTMEIYLTFKLDGDIVKQEKILEAPIESIRIDEGATSKTITLTGYKTESYTTKAIELTGETYRSMINGKIRYRVAVPSLDLKPGDQVTIGGDTFTADNLSYYFRATKNGIVQNMEIAE